MTPRIQLIAGLSLLAFGAMLLAWSILAAISPTAHYSVNLSTAPAESLRDFESFGLSRENIQRIEIRAADEKQPVAEGLFTREGAGRLTPLAWRNNVTEPIFFADAASADLSKVLVAIREHVPAEAVVFAWWDLSRAIRLAAQRDAPLDDARGRGLLMPAAWKNTAAQESARWGAGADAASSETFSRYVDALLMDEARGAEALKALARDKPAFIVAHISDIWKLAAARPEKIFVAYKDFPSSGASHGLIKSAQQFLRDEKIEGGYAVEPMGSATRLHYLPRRSDGDALIARLLPFSTSLAAPPTKLSLTYQHKGWWVWRADE
ncbi:MAG: hydroxylamine oxidation protein HaoB [Methylocystis sp.]|nr:hydroxylamine oxidation protein HaoB [Methylocystis sp.]